MKVLKEQFGNSTILIQAVDESLEIIEENQGQITQTSIDRATQTTGDIEQKLKEAYTGVKSAIKDIAHNIGEELQAIPVQVCPKEVKMEFNLGVSAQAGPIWILSGKGEYGLKVTMTWNLK